MNKVKDFIREVKYAYQRVVRNFDERAVWGIDEHLSIILPQMIRQLRNELHGHPVKLTKKKWTTILSAIADGFEAYWLIRNATFTDEKSFKKQQKILDKKFKVGMSLFVKYFSDLWD